MRSKSPRVLIVSLGMAVASSAAIAQDSRPLLSGPEVDDSGRLSEEGFGEADMMSTQSQRKAPDQQYTMRDFRSAMGVLEDTPDALSGEQRDEIRVVMRDSQREMMRFLIENRGELDRLADEAGLDESQRPWSRAFGRDRAGAGERERGDRGRRGARDAEGENPGGEKAGGEMQDGASPRRGARGERGTPGEPGGSQEAMERLREFRQAAPDQTGAVERAFKVLTDTQRALVRDELDRMTKERRDGALQRRAEQDVADRMQELREGGPEAERDAMRQRLSQAFLPDGSIDASKLPDRLRDRYERLDENEREQFVKRLRERLEF